MFDIDRKEHPRVRVSKQKISKALFSLLKKKKFEDVTIADIIEATKDSYGVTIGRQTFYTHFNSKLDVIEDYFLNFYKRAYLKIKDAKDSAQSLGLELSIKCINIILDEFKPFKTRILEILKVNPDPDLISHLNSIGMTTASFIFSKIYRNIFNLKEDVLADKTFYDTIITLSSASMAGFFSKWLTGEYKKDIDSIVEYTSRYNLVALNYSIAMYDFKQNREKELPGFLEEMSNLDPDAQDMLF